MLQQPEFPLHVSVDRIMEAAAIECEINDREGCFPGPALAALHRLGLTAQPPVGDFQSVDLLWTLAAIGRGDLSVGRIFEGHANALILMRGFGSAAQRARAGAATRDGALFGVWNTDMHDDPLRLEGDRLVGKKSFSTGVDGLSEAIVTFDDGPARQMLLVPLEGLVVDRSWWRPLGMRASGSHVVDFTGLRARDEWMLGAPGDYVRQPWFSAGAMRFAAVQVGGMHAVFDLVVEHLRRCGRTEDPYQRHRLGRLGIAVESGYGWLARAGDAWTEAVVTPSETSANNVIATADATRSAVESLALEVLTIAEQGVGAAGMIAPHALERLVRDLRTYLRQPNPDGALAAFGTSLADRAWIPGKRRPESG